MWFFLCTLTIGLVCSESISSSSNSRWRKDVYAKESRGESLENELDPEAFDIADADDGSRENSDSDQDDSRSQDCDIPNRLTFTESSASATSADGFENCQPAQSPTCDPDYPYRTINGTCNNLHHPQWGAASRCFRRYLPAHYTGFDRPRRSVTGASLPMPRQLSLNIFQDRYHPTKDASFMFTIYSQTIAHDISLSDFDIDRGSCCAPSNASDSSCMKLLVPEDDPFYSQYGVTCLEFFRTVYCDACNSETAQQITGQTAAIDASLVYAPINIIANGLRANDGTGKLLTNYTEKGEFLPSGNDPEDRFCPMFKNYECFQGGDPRVNQHSTLTSMQTLFAREHNRIAEELKKVNPHWDEERLYQEARRILIAQLQYIVYQEFLPLLLGFHYMSNFDLHVKPGSGGTKYNPCVPLEAWNEFATAAFRIHSIVATDVGALKLKFRELYSNPVLLWKGKMAEILQGVCTVPSEKFDRWFVKDVTDFLNKRPGEPYGLDLASLDLHRGRDHGMAPYVYYVYVCSDKKVDIQSFDDLAKYKLMSHEDAKLLKYNYARVLDIDLWVGLQLEYHSKGAKVGRTSACIISRQFYHLKYGDRFYFEHVGEAGSFTPDQRASIKQTSLSRLLCDNTDISKVQRYSMVVPSWKNPKVRCAHLPQVDLSLWKES